MGNIFYSMFERACLLLKDLFRQRVYFLNVSGVIIRLRNLFALDFKGSEMPAEAIEKLERHGKCVYASSANPTVMRQLEKNQQCEHLIREEEFCRKTTDALRHLHPLSALDERPLQN